MRFIAYLFASGDAFYLGDSFVILAIVGHARHWFNFNGPRARLSKAVLLWSGIIVVLFSAVPLPLWWYVLGLGGTFAALCQRANQQSWRNWQLALFIASCAWIAAGALWEITERWRGPVVNRLGKTLHIIGDSLSAETDDPNMPAWPRWLVDVETVNHARAGANTHQALRQAEEITDDDCIVLIEIGGNDLLSGTSSGEFRTKLEALLKRVRRPQRRIVMFELPLLPYCIGYGWAQRDLARRYDVQLIPRRDFARVVLRGDTTIGGLHLSRNGHAQMADLVRRHLDSN